MVLTLRLKEFNVTLNDEIVFTKKSNSEYIFNYQQTSFLVKYCSTFWQKFLHIGIYIVYNEAGKTVGYLKMRGLRKLEINLTYKGRKIVYSLIFIRSLVKLERKFHIESTYYEYTRAGWMGKDDIILLKNKKTDIIHTFLGSFMLLQLSRIGRGVEAEDCAYDDCDCSDGD